ncbi:MAG TPA: AAC(3) family N-acetyltransferase, partial [Mesotoga sp.]|nr:AAC(3) family N-acetyltransferase [Mesotoga sp.]
RVWKEFNDFDLDSDDFYIIGSDFERDFPSKVNKGMIGYAESTLLPQVELVDFAVEWMTKNRK